MLNSLLNPIKLPDYSLLKKYEGNGNFSIKNYYNFPHSLFYRHKLRMILDMMDHKKVYYNILDYGSGPGIFSKELISKCTRLTSFDKEDIFNPSWKFDLIICASVLEFVHLDSTLKNLKQIMHLNSRLIVASPMKTPLSNLYFKSISNHAYRHSHTEILSKLSKYFIVESKKEWIGLYFSVKCRI